MNDREQTQKTSQHNWINARKDRIESDFLAGVVDLRKVGKELKILEQMERPDSLLVRQEILGILKKNHSEKVKSNEGNQSSISAIILAAEEFAHAEKAKPDLWLDQRDQLNEQICSVLAAHLNGQPNKELAKLWQLLPDKQSSSALDRILEDQKNIIQLNLDKAVIGANTHLERYFRGSAHLEVERARIISSVGDIPELVSLIETKCLNAARSGFLENTVMHRLDTIVPYVPPHLRDALNGLSASEQEFLYQEFEKEPKDQSYWETMLGTSKISDIIAFHVQLQWPFYFQKEHVGMLVSLLETISVPECKALLLEKGARIKRSFTDLRDMVSFIRIARSPKVSAEELDFIPIEKWKWFNLFLDMCGEEKVLESWEGERVRGFSYSRQPEAANSEEFVGSLTPILKAHIPVGRRGYEEWPDCLESLQSVLSVVPVELRDDFFASLSSSNSKFYEYLYKDKPPINKEEVAHLQEWNTYFNGTPGITFEHYVSVRKYFQAPEWQMVQKGLEIYKKHELLSQVAPAEMWFEVLKLAGKESCETANQFYVNNKENPQYVRDDRYDREKHVAPRNARSLHGFYTCIDFFTTYGKADLDLLLKLFDFRNSDCEKAIVGIVDGSIARLDPTTVDVGIVEGLIVEVGHLLTDGRSELQPWYRPTYEDCVMFANLTRDQKLLFLSLREGVSSYSRNAGKLCELVVSEKGKRSEDQVTRLGLVGYSLAVLDAMSGRPDCAGLFKYIPAENMDDDQRLQLVEKLVHLRDAGFPAECDYVKDRQLILNRDYEKFFDWFMVCDIALLVRLANEAKSCGVQLGLTSILGFIQENTEEDWIRQIRSVGVMGGNYVSRYLDHSPFLTDGEMVHHGQRIREAGVVLGREVIGNERAALVSIPDVSWSTINSRPEALGFCLKQPAYIPAIDILSDTDLQHVAIQKYGAPADILLKNKAAVLSLAEQLVNIPFENPGDVNWQGLLAAQEKAPWLFTDEVLKNWQQPINVLAACADLTAAEWPLFQTVLDSYTFTLRFSNEVSRAIELFRKGEALMSRDELTEVTVALGTRPSWDLANDIVQAKRDGQSVKQIVYSVTQPDQDSHGVRYEWENEQYAHEYKVLIARNPKLSGVLTVPSNSYKSTREAPWLQRLNLLPDVALARMVRLEPFLLREHSSSRAPLFHSQESLENILFIVQHENFETVLEAITVRGKIAQLGDANSAAVMRFCEQITPAIVVSYGQLPVYFDIDLIDVPSFFLQPQCDLVVQGAVRMRKIANGKDTISAYDMLLMDLPTDLDSIESVADNTFLPLSADSLRGLEASATGEKKELLQKARAVFSWTSNLNPDTVMKCLAQISPELRAAVIKKKGVYHFGWPILAYREELISLGVAADELDTLAQNLYRNVSNQVIPDINLATAKAILIDLRAYGDRPERFRRVLNSYKGDWEPLVKFLFEREKKLFCETIFDIWGNVPEDLKVHPALWQALIKEAPGLVIAHFEKLPDASKALIVEGEIGAEPFHRGLVAAQDIFSKLGKEGTHALYKIYNEISAEDIRVDLVSSLKQKKLANVEILLKVKNGYDNDIRLFNEFRSLAEAGKHAICESLLEAKEYYKQDLEKLCIARDYLIDASSIYDIATLNQYAEIYKLEGRDRAREFVLALKKKAGRLINDQVSEELRTDPHYMFMVKYVFPEGNYSSYERNLACGDHLDHVAGYEYDRAGVTTEMSGLLGYKMKTGASEDQAILAEYQERLYNVKGFVASRGPSNGALQEAFTQKITGLYKSLVEEAAFRELKDITLHEMVAALLLNEVIKKAKRKEYRPAPVVLDVLVEYKYAFCEDLEQYIRRSADEALRLQDEVTRRVHLWRELSNIYGENIKHVARNEVFNRLGSSDDNRVIRIANDLLADLSEDKVEVTAKQRANIERTFSNEHIPLERKWDEKRQKEIASKSDVLEKQMLDICTANIKFRNEEARVQCTQSVKDVIEQNRVGLTQAVFFEVVVPKILAIRKLYLYDIYSKLEDVLVLDINRIEAELAKYEEVLEVEKKETAMGGPKEKAVVKSSKKRKIRHRITKTKETANARMGAYLCISGDPGMYNNPNYFEDIMQDEATGKCVGVNMFLNIETEDGKKYLWMGPNPFEGFLGQVSSTQCYRAMYDYAAKFAEENGFEGIVVPPEDSQILGACTNRGGDFPELIKSSRLRDSTGALRIVEFGKKHTLGGSYGYSSGALIWHRSMIAKTPDVVAA